MVFKIAILSPSKQAYSETFIQAHKKYLKGNIFYYFDGELPTKLENGLLINSRRRRILDTTKGYFRLNRFTLHEQALIKSFKKNKIDVVLAEYGNVAQRIVPVCKELKLPLIAHFHGYDASRKEIIFQNNQYKNLFGYAQYIIAVSRKMEQELLRLGCPREKLIYNTYGPAESFHEVQPEFRKPQFIAVGRFVDKKAPYYLILSFLEVVKEFPAAKLIIAGDGELWNSCKNLIKHYGLEKNIELPGVITREEFRSYLSESLAFVQHSITAEDGDSEGTPVAILEASAAGLPVISTIHAGIPDVIKNDESGFLVEEHDVMEMVIKMKKLLEKPEVAKKMGDRGKEIIRSNFSMEKHISALNRIIKESVTNNE